MEAEEVVIQEIKSVDVSKINEFESILCLNRRRLMKAVANAIVIPNDKYYIEQDIKYRLNSALLELIHAGFINKAIMGEVTFTQDDKYPTALVELDVEVHRHDHEKILSTLKFTFGNRSKSIIMFEILANQPVSKYLDLRAK